MPARRFDGKRLRSARLEAGYSRQADFAKQVEASRATVATWENGRGPSPERLPALAHALRTDINLLFPRHGAPDLADLRCDTGLTQYEVERRTSTKDHDVGMAERGSRPLTQALREALAALYGVTEEALLAAEKRSFGGKEAPLPTTLAEKIAYLLEHTYPGNQQPPSDADIACGINAAAGAEVTSAEDVRDLRDGTVTEVSPVVREGLAEVLGVSAFFFQPDEDTIVETIVEGLRTLHQVRNGDISIKARGMGPEGLPAELLAVVNDLASNLQKWARTEGGPTNR
ncbi:helix-turn-helix transcriptional regulator [Streptomyces sp. MNP-20]|uniref:helix-turn-helix transcriptional regulator n=1 Tax=Streptomyces sp. MNP-20 TaxID=2721165 RepID=UPI00155295AB|nr:helix-turn-helix transcriptional regulator [Streptomyces sp. MNP-20]